jgi:hypothetical protein
VLAAIAHRLAVRKNHDPPTRADERCSVSGKYQRSEDVPTEVLIARLQELVRAITKRGQPDWSEFYMRIPAEVDHDADIVLSEAARRLRAITNTEGGEA